MTALRRHGPSAVGAQRCVCQPFGDAARCGRRTAPLGEWNLSAALGLWPFVLKTCSFYLNDVKGEREIFTPQLIATRDQELQPRLLCFPRTGSRAAGTQAVCMWDAASQGHGVLAMSTAECGGQCDQCRRRIDECQAIRWHCTGRLRASFLWSAALPAPGMFVCVCLC